jgi:MFS family permease
MQKSSSQHVSIRKAVFASWIGSALEYYDFFLYGTAAVLFLGPLYFPNSEPGIVGLAAIASVGAGFISRTIGAFLLGYLGDVSGRRAVLCLTLLLMGLSTFLIGVLPTYQDIGIAAPVILVGLRLLQGFAVSGEQAGAQALVLELSTENQRGFYTSFALSGSLAGFILAVVIYMVLSSILPESDLLSWGWRIPFLFSVILVALGVWIRLKLPESPVFLVEENLREQRFMPLRTLWIQYKREMVQVVLGVQVSAVSSVVAVFSLSWAVNYFHIRMLTMLTMLVASAVVGTVVVPISAYLSDRIGRRPVFILGALTSGTLIWPYLWAISQSNIPLIFIFGLLLAGVAYNLAIGVWPSLYGEMFSTRVRLSGIAIGTQVGLLLGSQMPTIAALIIRYSPSKWASVALLVSVNCVISALAIFFSTETNRVRMGDLGRK